jgi:hypothetical protein
VSFSLDTETWQQIHTTGGPDGRAVPGAIVDIARDRMVMVGGARGFKPTRQVWALDLATREWSRLPSGPSARFDLTATTEGEKAWFFGGFDVDNRALNDLWELDLATDTWRRMPAPEAQPAPRTNAGFGLIDDRLILTGGHPERGINPNTWAYNLTRERWRKLREANKPLARAHMAYATDPTCELIWLFGGDRNDYKDSPELLALEPAPSVAFFPVAKRQPPPRRHAAIAFDPATRTLVLFGGWQGPVGQDTTLGDTWTATASPCA